MWYLNILNISQKSKKGNGKGGGGDRKITSNGRRPAGTTQKVKLTLENGVSVRMMTILSRLTKLNLARSLVHQTEAEIDLDINKDDLKTMVQHHML